MARRHQGIDRRELAAASAPVLADLARHAGTINRHYRAAAEAMGQLYMCADAQRLGALTRSLDQPMQQAAEVERVFSSLLHELQTCIAQTAPKP